METHEWVTTAQCHHHLRGSHRLVAGIARFTGTRIGCEYQGPHAGKTTTPKFPANDPAQSRSLLLLQHQTVASQKLLAVADGLCAACAQLDALSAEPLPSAPTKGSDGCKLHPRKNKPEGSSAGRITQSMGGGVVRGQDRVQAGA